MSITELLAQRDIQMQLFALFWILVGTFATWYAWKKTGSPTPDITLAGFVKKLFIGIFAWGLFIIAYPNIPSMAHIDVIAPAITWGLSAEVIVGAYVQQKLENYVKNRKKKE